MSDSLMKIGDLLDLQKRQTERALQPILQRRDKLRLQADQCISAASNAQVKSETPDVASATVIEKWARAQGQKAQELRNQAEALQPDIDQLTAELHIHLKKQNGFEELRKAESKKRALEEEEIADQELQNIVQLSRH